jgi:hypothetical protein
MCASDSDESIVHPDGIIIAASSAASDRICALLDCDSSSKVTVNALQSVLTDTFSATSLLLRDSITLMKVDPSFSAAQRQHFVAAKSLVHGFDGQYTTDRAAPVLLEAYRITLLSNLLRPLGALSGVASGGGLHAARRIGGASAR